MKWKQYNYDEAFKYYSKGKEYGIALSIYALGLFNCILNIIH
jgi:hypothetical protein